MTEAEQVYLVASGARDIEIVRRREEGWIGKEYNISAERVRQIVLRAKRR
jgi:hypothetical protein